MESGAVALREEGTVDIIRTDANFFRMIYWSANDAGSLPVA